MLPGTYTLSVTDASGAVRPLTTGTSTGLNVVANANTDAGVLAVG